LSGVKRSHNHANFKFNLKFAWFKSYILYYELIGNYYSIEDIQPEHTFVVTPSPESWSMRKDIDVVSLDELINRIISYGNS